MDAEVASGSGCGSGNLPRGRIGRDDIEGAGSCLEGGGAAAGDVDDAAGKVHVRHAAVEVNAAAAVDGGSAELIHVADGYELGVGGADVERGDGRGRTQVGRD